MNCQLCGNKIEKIIVPIPLKLPGKYLDAMACLKCARKSGLYCEKHVRPHLGYTDGTHACRECVLELTRANVHRATLIAGILREAAPEDFDLLREDKLWRVVGEDEEDVPVLFFLAETALAKGIGLDDLIRQLVNAGSLEMLKLRPATKF